MSIFGKTIGVRRPKGQFIIEGQVVAELLQCCHCNAQFVVVKGFEKNHGYCMRCGAHKCAREECQTCVPFEQRLESYEKGNRASL